MDGLLPIQGGQSFRCHRATDRCCQEGTAALHLCVCVEQSMATNLREVHSSLLLKVLVGADEVRCSTCKKIEEAGEAVAHDQLTKERDQILYICTRDQERIHKGSYQSFRVHKEMAKDREGEEVSATSEDYEVKGRYTCKKIEEAGQVVMGVAEDIKDDDEINDIKAHAVPAGKRLCYPV